MPAIVKEAGRKLFMLFTRPYFQGKLGVLTQHIGIRNDLPILRQILDKAVASVTGGDGRT